MIKRYNQYLNESLSFDNEYDDERVTINAYLDNKFIGKVVIDYVTSGYYEFEDEMSEDRYNELFPDDGFAKIEYISIDDRYTGKGYAKQLMYKALENIKENGEKTVYLNASPMGHHGMSIDDLVEFYKKFGFEIFIDDYDENKEMILKLEHSGYDATYSIDRTIDYLIKTYNQYIDKREEEKEKQRELEKELEEPVIIDEFDEDTPDLMPKKDIAEPIVRKNNSLGYGKTNMP